MKRLSLLFIALCLSAPAWADEVAVAVAANFTGPFKELIPQFERDTGHKVQASYGATGKFYAQINNGAPFDVFLSADDETPTRMVSEGSAVASSNFTYAIGKLVLWSATPGLVDGNGDILKKGGFQHLALANPKTAPYGAAAVQVLTQLGVLDTIKPLLVQGENIAQAQQFVASGAAELGFVAYSQVIASNTTASRFSSGSGWLVPGKLYDPIRQNAVLLTRAKDKPAAQALLNFLKSDKVKALLPSHGYALP